MIEKKSVVDITSILNSKHIEIQSAESFLNTPLFESKSLGSKETVQHSIARMNIVQVLVNSHALVRWNSRVGPKTDTSHLVTIIKSALLTNSERIELLGRELAILDNEIAFAYSIEEGVFTVTTFFGRISIVPSLANAETLRKYNQRYNEQINLELTDELLEMQVFPQAPASTLQFTDSLNIHELFYYKCESNKSYYVLLTRSKEESTWSKTLIDLQHVNRIEVNDMLLYVLGLLGHGDFIIRYIRYFTPSRYQQLLETYSNRAINRYIGVNQRTYQNRIRQNSK